MASPASTVQHLAPAKVNLALHVTGQRKDGYHLLDTLVIFTDFGDFVDLTVSEAAQATISGPCSVGLVMNEDNLVCRAERMWRDAVGVDFPPVHLHLTKNLPVASGIGGGSADAAATLLALQTLFEAPLPASRLQELALKLGADVPMCLLGTTLRATGIGEDIVPVDVESMAIVLVNPGMPVSTPAVFTALETKTNPPLTRPPLTNDQTTWIEWLREQRNDLQTSALANVPNISACLQALEEKPGYLLGRMSGSGATCFGLFDDDQSALKAVSSIRNANPDWWVQAGRTI